METYNSSSSSSLTSSSMYSKQFSEETKGLKMPQSYHSSLHSIRKTQMKPWKKPIAPLPPTPPRVYKVDPINFRDLVQKLTGAPKKEPEPEPEPQSRLQSVAPPPLDLFTPTLFGRDREIATVPLQLLPSPAQTPMSASLYQELMYESLDAKPERMPESIMSVSSSLELNMSPSYHAWCSYPLLSPGTLSSLEQGTVL